MDPELIITGDGSHTLSVPSMNEHYHSIHGAIAESHHIFIEAGLLYSMHNKKNIRVLEVGFGTGLNALLTFQTMVRYKTTCNYTAIENFPLPQKIVAKLNYPEMTGIPKETLTFMHECKWDEEVSIDKHFHLHKMNTSAIDMDFKSKTFDLVYFDAFGPDKQPEMWNEKIFENIFNHLSENAVLVTYSTKGEIKRILKKTGFLISKLPGPKGKREMLRAVKIQNDAGNFKQISGVPDK